MPYCTVGSYKADALVSNASDRSKAVTRSSNGEERVDIFYQRYGHGPTKVLLIIGSKSIFQKRDKTAYLGFIRGHAVGIQPQLGHGLAGNHESWGPQVQGLCGTDVPRGEEDVESAIGSGGEDCSESDGLLSSDDGSKSCSVDGRSSENGNSRESKGNGIEVCTFDNRGVGKSFIPKEKSEYSTKAMAEDALALLNHLGWEKAHVCGHSMGGMVACKLAAMAPHRLFSLTLIGVTGGGYQCFPKFNRRSVSLAYRIYRAETPEERAAVDLETHYTHDYLEPAVGEEYVKNLMSGGMQPRYGLEGQASACWNHSLSSEELETIRSAGAIVAVVHGRGDVIAQVEHARTLAKKLQPVSRMIELSGGHLVTHQNTDEVNGILLGIFRAVRMNVQCTEFKASDAGLYDGGDYWQTEVVVQEQGTVALPSQGSSESVIAAFWRKVIPDLLDLWDLVPSLQWISNFFGIDKLWKKVSVQ